MYRLIFKVNTEIQIQTISKYILFLSKVKTCDLTNRKNCINIWKKEKQRINTYREKVHIKVIGFQYVLLKIEKIERYILSKMNSNEGELRCYANGNVNKAEYVRAHRILHISSYGTKEGKIKKRILEM